MRVSALLAAVAACGGQSTLPDAAPADAEAQADAGADAGTTPDFLTVVRTQEEYDALALARGVKFLLRVDGVAPRAPILERCYFQNTRRWEFHIQFLQAFPETARITAQEYQALVLRPATRVWWGGGTILLREPHPIAGGDTTLAYQIYAENGAVVGLREADIVEVDAILRACLPYAAPLLAFLPGDPFQEQLARTLAPRLTTRGIAVILR